MFFKNVPLFYVNINKKTFKENIEGSCLIKPHPAISKLPIDKQEEVKALINKAIDIMRENIAVEDL
jgi:hypothetical protein